MSSGLFCSLGSESLMREIESIGGGWRISRLGGATRRGRLSRQGVLPLNEIETAGQVAHDRSPADLVAGLFLLQYRAGTKLRRRNRHPQPLSISIRFEASRSSFPSLAVGVKAVLGWPIHWRCPCQAFVAGSPMTSPLPD